MANRKKADRAKQFIPFDALKGFREALKAEEKRVVERKELPGNRRGNAEPVSSRREKE